MTGESVHHKIISNKIFEKDLQRTLWHLTWRFDHADSRCEPIYLATYPYSRVPRLNFWKKRKTNWVPICSLSGGKYCYQARLSWRSCDAVSLYVGASNERPIYITTASGIGGIWIHPPGLFCISRVECPFVAIDRSRRMHPYKAQPHNSLSVAHEASGGDYTTISMPLVWGFWKSFGECCRIHIKSFSNKVCGVVWKTVDLSQISLQQIAESQVPYFQLATRTGIWLNGGFSCFWSS